MMLAGLAAASAGTVMVLISCLPDPREGETVMVIDSCDTARLSTDPASGEATLHAYVNAADALIKQSTAAEAALRDACNAINKDLNIKPGMDSTSACSDLSTRIQNILKSEPPAPTGAFAVTHFAELFFPNTCVPTPGVLETCLSGCAGPCDNSKCEPGKLAGTCSGDCLGTCTEIGDNVPCKGTCSGETLGVDNEACTGECVGECTAPIWTGTCTASCPRGFNGLCKGTCTGKCTVGSDKFTVGDAGAPADAGDAGPDTGLPPPPPPIVKPPDNDPGNCKGICDGVCSDNASGFCNASCLTFAAGAAVGKFSGGFCGNAGVPLSCTGTCRAQANGSTSACKGACTQLAKPKCSGVCRAIAAAPGGDGGANPAAPASPCTGPITNGICEGELRCGQNAQCNNACQATAQLAAVCAEPAVGSFVLVTDPPLYDALVKHAGALGKAVNLIAQARSALNFISKTELGDFKSAPLSLSGDLLRVCVEKGRKNVTDADALVAKAGNANPIVYRKPQ